MQFLTSLTTPLPSELERCYRRLPAITHSTELARDTMTNAPIPGTLIHRARGEDEIKAAMLARWRDQCALIRTKELVFLRKFVIGLVCVGLVLVLVLK